MQFLVLFLIFFTHLSFSLSKKETFEVQSLFKDYYTSSKLKAENIFSKKLIKSMGGVSEVQKKIDSIQNTESLSKVFDSKRIKIKPHSKDKNKIFVFIKKSDKLHEHESTQYLLIKEDGKYKIHETFGDNH